MLVRYNNLCFYYFYLKVTLLPKILKSPKDKEYAVSPPDRSLPGSWQDTCIFPHCLRGGQQEAFWRPLRRRRGATPCEQTENEELGSEENLELPKPS